MAVKFYVVKQGRKTGIYHTWDECLSQVKGFKGAVFKSFPKLTEAQAWLNNTSTLTKSSTSTSTSRGASKFYAVHKGHTPGVYTDWSEASAQITGCQYAPVHKAFKTQSEALEFVKNGYSKDQSLKRSSEDSQKPPPAKKAKNTSQSHQDDPGKHPAGEGPLPSGAEDGFDPRISLNPVTGKVEYKDSSTKWQAVNTDEGPLVIYTDGSSLGNGAHGAVAGVGVYFGPKDQRNVSEPLPGTRQTNQRAELTAIQRALELAPRNRPVTIYTDSNYAIKCVTEWFVKWRANGWLNSSKKPVENKDLIEKILALISQRRDMAQDQKNKVEFIWVKGHSTNEGNAAADQLAVAGAREAKNILAAGDFDIEP